MEVALSAAGFEAGHRSQQRLLDTCRALAHQSGAVIVPGLPWEGVPGWLAGAAAVIVPSLAETFGLVAFDIDNFPALIGSGGPSWSANMGTSGSGTPPRNCWLMAVIPCNPR